VDLQEVRLDQVIQTAIEITLVGDSIGVREGGVLNQVTNEINIEALPLEVPQGGLEADVSELGIGESLRLSQVAIPEGVTLLDDPDEVVIASVQMAREETGEELDLEAEEAAEGADTEAAQSETVADGGGDDSSEG
jgi:large subunit ribosomal protein L25